MDRETFLSLPPAVALRILFDALDEETSAAVLCAEAPKSPRSPKYDRMIHRQGSFQWASETSAEGLRFWHKRATESAAKGGQYADKDAKQAAELARWIEYREWFPYAPWSGERGNETIVAAPPADKPRLYQRQQNGQRRAAPPPEDDTSFNPETF